MNGDRTLYEFGTYRLEPDERLLTRQGIVVSIPPKAFDTLLYLVQNSGRLLLKDEMMRVLWPNAFVEEVNLAQNISQLRKVLGSCSGGREFIETVPKSGYRFTATTRLVKEGPATLLALPASARIDHTVDSALPRETIPVKSPRQISLWLLLALAATVLVAFAALAKSGWYLPRGGSNNSPRISSLVILPLENVSGDPSQDPFALGMTDLLATELAKIPSLRVVSRTSGLYYKSHPQLARQIARDLDVDTILEGSIMRSANKVRLSAQLINARDDSHIWAETYERDVQDALSIQDELAHSVAETLRLELSPHQTSFHPSSTNPAAIESYLRGRALFGASNVAEIARAQAYFQDAISKDPNYAPAYAALGRMYWALLYRGAGAEPNDILALMKSTSDKALELDDRLADSHATRALALIGLQNNWSAGEVEFRRAFELNPGEPVTHLYYAVGFLSPLGRHDEAIASLTKAIAIVPDSVEFNAALGWTLIWARKYDLAEAQFHKTLVLDPKLSSACWGLMELYEQEQKWPAAMAALQIVEAGALKSPPPAYSEAFPKTQATRELYWERRLSLQEQITQEISDDTDFAVAYARAGQSQKALDFLTRAVSRNEMRAKYLKVEPAFDPLRSDLRFRKLVDKFHFPSM